MQSAQYWPSTKDSPEKMDEFITELVSEGAFEDYVVREIKLTQATVSIRLVKGVWSIS